MAGWKASDVDVLSNVRANENWFPERDASGRLMNRRQCPQAPEGFEWQATLHLDKPQKRMQHPPDFADLGAQTPQVSDPDTKPTVSQEALYSMRNLPNPRYTNVAETSDKRKVEVVRMRKSDLADKKKQTSLEKKAIFFWRESLIEKTLCQRRQ